MGQVRWFRYEEWKEKTETFTNISWLDRLCLKEWSRVSETLYEKSNKSWESRFLDFFLHMPVGLVWIVIVERKIYVGTYVFYWQREANEQTCHLMVNGHGYL